VIVAGHGTPARRAPSPLAPLSVAHSLPPLSVARSLPPLSVARSLPPRPVAHRTGEGWR
jgi:hypothetical protein